VWPDITTPLREKQTHPEHPFADEGFRSLTFHVRKLIRAFASGGSDTFQERVAINLLHTPEHLALIPVVANQDSDTMSSEEKTRDVGRVFQQVSCGTGVEWHSIGRGESGQVLVLRDCASG
jgi:hypothetical protein